MKRLLVPLMLGFGMALAWVVARRMSTDAMAVVIGVAVGVASSVPTSLLLVALLRRERAMTSLPGRPERETGYLGAQPPAQPPSVVVLNAGDLAGMRRDTRSVPLPPVGLMQDGGMRRLRVVGEDEEWD
jgi:hypothetical protein